MHNISRRLDRVEKRLCAGEKPPFILKYTDDNGVEQKIEMPADKFEGLLREIDGSGIRSPFEQLKGICRTNRKSVCAP